MLGEDHGLGDQTFHLVVDGFALGVVQHGAGVAGLVLGPPGIPVATMSVGSWGARNAAIFAARILALRHPKIAEALDVYREEQRKR